MELNNIDDANLRSRLAYYGIVCPITKTTKKVLLQKLQKLEIASSNNITNQPNTSECVPMDTTVNDLNEYEIKENASKLGFNQIPLTDTTRPVLSRLIKKNSEKLKK